MKILRCSFVIIILLVTATWGQTKSDSNAYHPNLSGTWYLDIDSLPKSSRKAIRDYVLTIEHNGDELKINRKYVENEQSTDHTETIYTDKRKEENFDTSGATWKLGFGKIVVTSRSFWKKGSIIREFIYDKSDVRQPYLIDKQIIALSNDGKILTITTEFQPNTKLMQSMQKSTMPDYKGPLPPLDVSTQERKLTFTKINPMHSN